MKTKSVIAGEYTAPPAHGPMMAEICGITPEAERIAQEDVGVGGQRHDTFLDPGAARVVEPDDGHPGLHRQIHDLANLARIGLRERPAEHREVLCEDEDRTTVDASGAGDHAVAGDTSARPCRSRGSDARRTGPSRRSFPCRAEGPTARAPSSCRRRAVERSVPRLPPGRQTDSGGGVRRSGPRGSCATVSLTRAMSGLRSEYSVRSGEVNECTRFFAGSN